MARRKFLKIQDQQELFGVPTDEDSLIRHYTLSPSDRLEIEVRRRKHNQLGFAVQLCMMRHPGRALMVHEIPPRAMLNYIAEQLDADPESFRSYARREETRREHIAHLLSYLENEQQQHRTGAPPYYPPSKRRPQRTRAILLPKLLSPRCGSGRCYFPHLTQ